MYDLEYYIYHAGYGPTNETLGKFIRELFGQDVAQPSADGHARQDHRARRHRAAQRNAPECHETRRRPNRQTRADPNRLLRRIPDANLKKTLALAERAARRGAQIICTQELFRSQYFCQSEDHENFKLAETIPGPSTDAFCKLAKKHKVVIIASLFEKRAAGVYHNTAADH